MSYSTTQSILFAKPYVQFSPLTQGTGSEPGTSAATMIRNSILGAPMIWPWNRAESASINVTNTNQDYTVALTDFGFLEKAVLTDDKGASFEIKYPLNNDPLVPVSAGVVGQDQGRPVAITIQTMIPFTSVKVRLLPAPQKAYTMVLVYQKAAPPFVSGDAITQVTVGSPAVYAGTFTLGAYPVGSSVVITGFTNSGNNGTFVVTAATTTTLSVTNAGAVNETHAGVATNPFWSPIPDFFMDVYNNLFLSEAFASVDEPQRAQFYRIRGVSALLGRAEGLTQAQKSAFMQSWHIMDVDNASVALKLQQGTQARGV